MTTTEQLGDLTRFCDPDDILTFCTAPFSKDGFTWYGDGKIFVRVPHDALIPQNDKAPNITKLFDANWRPGEWISVPSCQAPPDEECKWCGGYGVLEFDTGHECDNCNGKGVVPALLGMDVGDTYLNHKYLAKIQGWEISTRGPVLAANIRLGDAIGLLMPMRKDK